MSRYIDQDALCEFARHSTIGIDANDIMRFPSIEIIHCKDCKYANKERLPQGSKWFASCDHFNTHSVMADDYCNYAKRKEAEE